jgi:hypothetical protein
MIRTIKKGKVLTSIQCSNGFYSNNLYCEDIKIKPDDSKQAIAISLDYSKEYRKKTSDKYDFQNFVENIDKLESISFFDTHSISNIKSYFSNNDKKEYKRQVELLIDKPYILDVKFRIKGTDEFKIAIAKAESE